MEGRWKGGRVSRLLHLWTFDSPNLLGPFGDISATRGGVCFFLLELLEDVVDGCGSEKHSVSGTMDVDPKSDEEGCSFQSLSLTELASSQRTSFTDVFSETKETVARFASRASRRAQFRRVGFGSPASVVREREVWRPGRADACARMAQVFAVIGCLASRAQELDWLVGTGLNGTASRRK